MVTDLVVNQLVQLAARVPALQLLQSPKMVHVRPVHIPEVQVVHHRVVLTLREMRIRRGRERVEVVVIHLHLDQGLVCL